MAAMTTYELIRRLFMIDPDGDGLVFLSIHTEKDDKECEITGFVEEVSAERFGDKDAENSRVVVIRAADR